MRMVARYAGFEQSDLDDIMIRTALPATVAESRSDAPPPNRPSMSSPRNDEGGPRPPIVVP